MDSDVKKTLIFGALTGLSSFGLYYFNGHLNELNKKRQQLEEQANTYTPYSLQLEKGNFTQKNERFGVVSGVCMHKSSHEDSI